MKPLLLILFIVSICAMTPSKKPTTPIVEPPKQEQALKLAWGDMPVWTKALTDAVNASDLKEVKSPCKTLKAKDCLIQTISIMAKFESGFKPETSYKEGFNDSKGKAVISRGLLQISQESANQSAYACGIKKAEDLHDPKVNLECAVKIAVYWINKDQVFFGGEKLGLGRYWSVGRKSSKSNAKILSYLSNLTK